MRRAPPRERQRPRMSTGAAAGERQRPLTARQRLPPAMLDLWPGRAKRPQALPASLLPVWVAADLDDDPQTCPRSSEARPMHLLRRQPFPNGQTRARGLPLAPLTSLHLDPQSRGGSALTAWPVVAILLGGGSHACAPSCQTTPGKFVCVFGAVAYSSHRGPVVVHWRRGSLDHPSRAWLGSIAVYCHHLQTQWKRRW